MQVKCQSESVQPKGAVYRLVGPKILQDMIVVGLAGLQPGSIKSWHIYDESCQIISAAIIEQGRQ